MSKAIVVPADIYDYHEFVSEVYGGVGHTVFVDSQNQKRVPCCIIGQAQEVYYTLQQESDNNTRIMPTDVYYFRFQAAAGQKFYDSGLNDAVVKNYCLIHGGDRMPWDEYCKARNIVRGD